MYGTAASGTSGLDSLFSGVVAGGLIGLGFGALIVFFSASLSYLFIKAAVRNGVIEAIKKTGLDSGGSRIINGYPPDQSYGAPVAPNYRGPNG